ncbi:MAG: DNA recombination protein RmuC [Kiritimatiellae bacterium]|nr:DNA recombination protein RmuC [Kiritimatiellia bacterium]
MEELIPAAVTVVAVLLLGWWIRRVLQQAAGARRDEQSLSMLQNQINANSQQTAQTLERLQQGMSHTLTQVSGQLAESLANVNKTVGDRLDNTTKVIGDVRQQLGQLDESSKRLLEVGKDISSLQDILKPPKPRGGMGELLLADLLQQILPPRHFELQHAFKGGERVDAVIRLGSGMVPVDAKFPLENFRRVIDSSDEEAAKAARRLFVRDVRKHIADIASKYIRQDEGTFDFALMYIPAENVYYEVIIKDADPDSGASLFHVALQKRVIPVSPNSFYAYLQTVLLGLKGMRVEERAREILDNLSRLRRELGTFAQAFRVVGQHLDNSAKKYQEAEKRFSRLDAKMEQVDGMVKGLDPEAQPPDQLPAGNDP